MAGMDIEELKKSVVNLMLKLKQSWRQVAFMTVSSAGMDLNKRYVAYQYNSWLNKEAEKKGIHIIDYNTFANVSTHSRPKAAGRHFLRLLLQIGVSTHSRPKAAG